MCGHHGFQAADLLSCTGMRQWRVGSEDGTHGRTNFEQDNTFSAFYRSGGKYDASLIDLMLFAVLIFLLYGRSRIDIPATVAVYMVCPWTDGCVQCRPRYEGVCTLWLSTVYDVRMWHAAHGWFFAGDRW